MIKASWKGVTLAESNETIVVEGNHYFPPEAVKMDYMIASKTKTVCPWKGKASYFTIKIGDDLNVDAAWFYPETKDAANNIRGRIAFWRGVEVSGNNS